MYDTVLVPTDGSQGMAHVALQAIDLAQQYDASISVLHVISDDILSVLPDTADREELRAKGRNAVDRIESMAAAHDVDAVTELREGDPAQSILEYADEIDADLIVAGTHGRSGIRRRVIGSVAERLVRYAACPVMTIRLPETDVTVRDTEHAERLAADALDGKGYDAEIAGAERHRNVWVVTAEVDDGSRSVPVYVDPVTQRTSVVSRA